MWVLLIILFSFGLLLMLLTYLSRRKKDEDVEVVVNMDEECCGAHEVCERDSLLSSGGEIEYFDDEELDRLSGIEPDAFSESQQEELAEVFYTLNESDVAAWLRSLQLRNIQLTADLKEQALLIVRERRGL